MTPEFSELLDALRQRLAVVADRAHCEKDPDAHLARLQQAAARVDSAIANLPPDTHPMLRHYLERQSFTKAIMWLEEQAGN